MSITIDQQASDKLKEILSERNLETTTIRIFLAGMGCGGPSFNLAQDEEKEGDLVHDFEGMKYVVENDLVEQFGGFDILLVDQGDVAGLYVQPKNMPEGNGCSSCSGCH